jgi:hypothetical protein
MGDWSGGAAPFGLGGLLGLCCPGCSCEKFPGLPGGFGMREISSRLVVEKIKCNKEAVREVEVVLLKSRYSA